MTCANVLFLIGFTSQTADLTLASESGQICLCNTHTQLFYSSLDFVRDIPSEPVPEAFANPAKSGSI